MASGVDLSAHALTGLANDIRDFHHTVSERVTSLNRVVDMIQAGWKGAAGKEFDTVQQGVNRNLKKLQDDLVDLEEAMRASVGGFTDQEQERISDIRKVDNSYEVTSRITDLA
ncbi:WXG100 family type VII secretion target [Streptomyces griseoluteus]|uniref:WXG100 family type VII secretion target n=1 Tax=Streptomyces griseoluteus TaxID=29306 RepID=UPI0036FE95CF